MSERQGLVFVLGLYLFFAVGYSLLMPMWEAPDEPEHYLYALTILKEKRAPTEAENRESFQPPLYYWGASRVLWVLEHIKPSWVVFFAPTGQSVRQSQETQTPVYKWSPENFRVLVGALTLRWVSVVLGGVTVGCIYQGAKVFWEEEPRTALTVAGLVGLTPQFLHVSSAVTNDALANLAGAGMFWLFALVLSGKVHGKGLWVSAGLGLFLPLITKLTALPMGLALCGAVIWRVRTIWFLEHRRLLIAGVGVSGLGMAMLLWVWPQLASNLWAEFVWRMFTVRENLWEIPLGVIFLAFTQSYWCKVGWLTLGIPPGLSYLLTAFIFVGWGLAVFWMARQPAKERFRWGMVGAGILLAFAIVIKNTLTTPQFQGRFFFPEIGLISILAVTGWTRWMSPRGRLNLFWAVMIFLVGLNFWFWSTKIIPFYFQPFLDWT